MKEDTENIRFIDEIIDDAISSPPEFTLPDSFTDDLVRSIETMKTWRILWSEFGMKMALVLLSLGILVATLLFPFRSGETSFIDSLILHRQTIIITLTVLLFTFFVDQVLLRFFLLRKENH